MDIDSLIKQANSGNYLANGNIEDGDCVIGFSFGFRREENKIIPGLSNEDLATYILKSLKNYPLILQFEIAEALNNKELKIFRISEHRKAGEYLDTSEVAKQAQEIMKKNKWKNSIIVAHPFHLPRVNAVCRKIGINTIVPTGLEKVRFDTNSAQEWTSSKEAWIKREEEAIKLSVKRGLI